MDVDEIIRQWYRVAVDEERQDVFFRFIALWIAFNAHYVSRYHHFDDTSARVTDHKYVRRFAQEAENVRRHRKLLNKRGDYASAVAVLAASGVRDVISQELFSITESTDLFQVCETVYQVRCNIFHGGKLRGNPRDENLTSAAFVVLDGLLAPVVQTDGE